MAGALCMTIMMKDDKEFDRYYWYELHKFGKFEGFVNRLRLIAMNKEDKLEGKASIDDFYVSDSEMRRLMNLGAKDGRNVFGVELETLRKEIELRNQGLRDDDYYRHCELDLEYDYDRANPATGYAAEKVFLRRRWKRDQKRVQEETEGDDDGDQEADEEVQDVDQEVEDLSEEGGPREADGYLQAEDEQLLSFSAQDQEVRVGVN